MTLRGTVGSYAERRETTCDVLRIRGVLWVENELKVELLHQFRRAR